MNKRLQLHSVLLGYLPNVYYQPPANIQMVYPCIVYNKTGKYRQYAEDVIYLSQQEYNATVIDKNPDSEVAELMEKQLTSCTITNYYTTDNLHHTNLKLYY